MDKIKGILKSENINCKKFILKNRIKKAIKLQKALNEENMKIAMLNNEISNQINNNN